jgi:hypothetical protein
MKNKDHFGLPAIINYKYNSNNDWGFGGSRGTNYEFASNLSALVAYAGTRHQGEFPFIGVWYGSSHVLDLSGHGKVALKKAKDIVEVCLILNTILSE